MAAIDTMQRFIMRGLQSQLQPDFIALLPIFAEQVQHRIGNAVGAGADAQPNDIRLAHRLLIH